jgi:hypothetical protein
VTVDRLSDDIVDLRHDFRRVDVRRFLMLLIRVATRAAAVDSLVAALVS